MPLPSAIADFLREQHVVGLATLVEGEPWAASCFYAFDETDVSLVLMSSVRTRHGIAMLEHPRVAGTVAGQPSAIAQIRGIQFLADAHLLAGEAADAARALYCRRHPIARLMDSGIWRLTLAEIKYTDNAKLFGSKTRWRRARTDDPAAEPMDAD